MPRQRVDQPLKAPVALGDLARLHPSDLARLELAVELGPEHRTSNHGFGPPIPGEILRVQVPSIADDAGADMQ